MNPPYAIIRITCCMNCAHGGLYGEWCTLNKDVTIPDGYCKGYAAEDEEGEVDEVDVK